MLTPHCRSSRSIDLPVCLARFPGARLWLKDEGLDDSANLPDPDVIAAEIVEDLESALQQFAAIGNDIVEGFQSALAQLAEIANNLTKYNER